MINYLDYNSTSPLHDLAKGQIVHAMDVTGNPSSTHKMGIKARMVVDDARYCLAKHFSIRPEQVIFTSGGTESNNLVLKGYASIANGKTLLVSKLEHPSIESVSAGLKEVGFNVEHLPYNEDNTINLTKLEELLKTDQYGLISLSYVNSETGIIQDVKAVADLAKQYNCLIHTDATQAWSKVDLGFNELGVNLMTLSAHKVGLAKGVGIVLTDGKINLPSLLHGGSQERGRRAGTENTLALATLHVVDEVVADILAQEEKLREFQIYLEQELKAINPNAIIVGERLNRVANTTFVISPGLDSQTQVISFDMKDICVSAGSACSSGDVKASKVITALGFNDQDAKCGIRVSYGFNTTKEDIDNFIQAYKAIAG